MERCLPHYAGLDHNRPVSLLQLQQCRPLLEHWQHRGLQQDCAEFLHRLLEIAKPAAYNGFWQGRLLLADEGSSRVHIRDQGQTFCPVAMELQEGSLQLIINHLESQMPIHALQVLCKLLMLQLMRLTQGSNGAAKDYTRVALQPGQVVTMPIFQHGMQRTYQPYRLVAVVYHVGATMHQGHYRAALIAVSFTRTGSWKYMHYLTDDGKKAALATEREADFFQQNCYLIGLQLQER